jgi:hypothetical protein
MITSAQCLKKYGDPNLLATQNKWFEVWVVDEDIRQAFSHVRFSAVGTIGFPKKIFVNRDFQPVLEKALRLVIERNLAHEMTTWDGCFIIRNKRGLTTLSIHSWACAVDINAFENLLGHTPKLSRPFIQCFIDAGCDAGADWAMPRTDGMHFQLAKI